MILDENDPVERALLKIAALNRKKRADYAHDDDIFSNFAATAEFAGFEVKWMSALFNCQQKLSRIASLRANGRLTETANESVMDSLLDNAVYAVIALGIAEDDLDRQEPGGPAFRESVASYAHISSCPCRSDNCDPHVCEYCRCSEEEG